MNKSPEPTSKPPPAADEEINGSLRDPHRLPFCYYRYFLFTRYR